MEATRKDGSPWWNVEGAETEPFYLLAERTPETGPKSLEELLKMVAGISKRIDKMVEKNDVVEGDVELAKVLSAQLSSIKIERPKASNDTNPTEVAVA